MKELKLKREKQIKNLPAEDLLKMVGYYGDEEELKC